MIYVLSVYRTMEILQGRQGFLLPRPVLYLFDGYMMARAVFIFSIINPASFLIAPELTNREEGL